MGGNWTGNSPGEICGFGYRLGSELVNTNELHSMKYIEAMYV